jgi:ribosomal protein S18 acetylase RimI-like enzyme
VTHAPTHAPRIVPARPEHHAEFTRFFRELEVDDPVPEPGRWAEEMMPQTFFLEVAGHLVGYAFSEAYGPRGYVRHVVVAPAARRKGHGRALMKALAQRLRQQGCTRWELNVKVDNLAAIRLYEHCGLRVAYRSHALRLAWAALGRLPAPPRAPEARAVEPAQDRALEAAFRLPQGLLARLRGLAGSVLLELVQDGEPVAFARFDPAFPGCFPFHVRSPQLARPLLEALHPRARHGDLWLQVVVEGDPATAQALIRAGAEEVLEILHLEGPLPAG